MMLRAVGSDLSAVIAGLDPAIHLLNEAFFFDGCAGLKRVHARLPTRYARA
jgi:hypothetical protein